MRSPSGAGLLVLILLAAYAVTCSRAVFHDGRPPAFFVETRPGIGVFLGEAFPNPGLHQFYDGTSLKDVIEMTGFKVAPALEEDPRISLPLCDGEFIDIHTDDFQVIDFRREWLSAAERMSLGIPLHPDRMSEDDWRALSGIGSRLAQSIEEDRQLNGDFGSLDALQRVKGIGSRRLEGWRKFF